MNFINKQDVVAFQIGQNRRQIAGFGNHRRRSRPETDPKLFRHNRRQRRFAQSRRTEQQYMIQRFAAFFGRFDKHLQVFADLLLPDKIRQAVRPQVNRRVQTLFVFGLFLGADQSFFHKH